MKRLLSLLLIFLLLFSLTACSAKEEEKAKSEDSQKEEATEEYPGLSADPDVLTQDPVDPDRVAAETMVTTCVNAMLTPDFDVILDMIHPGVMASSLRQKGFTDSQYQAMIDSYNARAQAAMDEITGMCNEWEFEAEILDYEDMTSVHLNSLDEYYQDLGIRINDGIEAYVQMYVIADGVKIPLQQMSFAFIECDGQWYLEASLSKLIDETPS